MTSNDELALVLFIEACLFMYYICRSFDSLVEDLTKQLGERLNGAIRSIYSIEGKKIEKLDELNDHASYVCTCNNENFKKMEYSSNSVIKIAPRVSKNGRPSSPMKNGHTNNGTMTTAVSIKDETAVVFPRIVTLIRNGVKPRKIRRMLLNRRNSPTFEHILQAITQVIKLDSGCVRKVFKLDGTPVTKLADFFDPSDDVFFAYGNERVGNDDFDLEHEESKSIRQAKKTVKNGAVRSGPKPKMPVKSHNDTFGVCIDEELLNGGVRIESLPIEIQKRFQLGQMVGDGNFAVVLKVKDKLNNDCEHALKIIDKSKCKGKVSDEDFKYIVLRI